jgi:hypothetical protein
MENTYHQPNINSYKAALRILEDLSKKGYWHTVGLLPLDKQRKRHGVGSGVLSRSEDVYAILTADHVADEIKKYPTLGLAFGTRRDISQMLFIPSEGLVVKTIARGKDVRLGPDLALVILPACHIGQIKAKALFYNLEDHPELHFNEPHQNTLVCTGILGKNITQKDGYEIIPLGELAMVAHPEIDHRGDFDYITCLIDDKPLGVRFGLENEITSFEGVSGAPLWQVQNDMSLRLIGIAYYQDLENPNDKKVIFHGPKGIYAQVKNVLKSFK